MCWCPLRSHPVHLLASTARSVVATRRFGMAKGPAALCGVAKGVHTRVPARGRVWSPLSVVAGMMVMRLARTSLEGQLVDRALRSWVPMAATWLDVLVLRECGALARAETGTRRSRTRAPQNR